MSTGGKVLVVMVTLFTLVWLGLMSMVARLNWNHGERVQAGEKAIAALEQQVSEATTQLQKLENDVVTSHMVNDDSRTLLRIQYNDQEKTLAEITENLSRMEGLFNNLELAKSETLAHIEVRKKETVEDQAKLKTIVTETDQSKQRNSDLLAKLSDLRLQFSKLVATNTEIFSKIGTSQPIKDVSPGAPLITGR
jgi:chromosome segregation ATPase